MSAGPVCLLLLLSFFDVVSSQSSPAGLVCRRCGHTVTVASQVLDMPHSCPSEQFQYMLELLGRNGTVHVLVNPAKELFHVFTARTASMMLEGTPQPGDTWFPDTTWTIGVCPKCRTHLGWFYQSTKQKADFKYDNSVQLEDSESEEKDPPSFVGVVLDKVISSHYINDHVVKPRSP